MQVVTAHCHHVDFPLDLCYLWVSVQIYVLNSDERDHQAVLTCMLKRLLCEVRYTKQTASKSSAILSSLTMCMILASIQHTFVFWPILPVVPILLMASVGKLCGIITCVIIS